MKLYQLSYLLLLCFPLLSSSQDIAISERGDSVLLYSNGTWDYLENYRNDSGNEDTLLFNENDFTKPVESKSKINGLNKAYEVWYNDKKWKRVPTEQINPEADIALTLTKGDAYAMVIYEEISIPMENLSKIALDNALLVAPDIKPISKEFRVVNGDTLIFMRMEGSTQGMDITYYSYYYSNSHGSIQFHTFTGTQVFEKYKNDLKDLLSGFIIPKNEVIIETEK